MNETKVRPDELEDEQEFTAQYPDTPLCVYRLCKDTARKQEVIPYEEVNLRCNLCLNFDHTSDRVIKLGGMLGDVSRFEVKKGRSMLSAVVVLKILDPIYGRMPAGGFFDWDLADQMRKPGEDNQLFFARMLKEVFAYWSQHP